jgi:hypothetical protein
LGREAKLNRSATQKLIAQYPSCCFCGGTRPSTTREHMPPKALFDNAHRPDKLVMPACQECNSGTRAADLVASIVSRWNYVNKEQENVDHSRLVARIRKAHPELLKEWTSLKAHNRIGAIAHLQAYGVPVPPNPSLVSIGPLTIRQLNLFSHKVALGLYFEHFKVPLPDEGAFAAFWRTKEDFAVEGIPAELLEIMRQYGTLEQGKWNVHEIFEYRYQTNKPDGLFACLARFRGNLFVTGLVAGDARKVETLDSEWIKPSDLLGILSDARFEKRP